MTLPAMSFFATIVSSAATSAEPIAHASEMPELASMALLSVVLAGASIAVRRTGPKADDRDRRGSGTSPRP